MRRPRVDALDPDDARAGERVVQGPVGPPRRWRAARPRAPRTPRPGPPTTRRPRRSCRSCPDAARSSRRSARRRTGRSGPPGSRPSPVLKTASPKVSPSAPNARPPEHRAVLERQERRRASAHRRRPSRRPRSARRGASCARTRPRSVRPRNALLRAFEANGGSTVHASVRIEHARGSPGGRARAGRRGRRPRGSSPARADSASIARASDDDPGVDELGEDDRERRLQADRARGRAVELRLLLLDRVRRVVGRDRVDRAVGEPRRAAPSRSSAVRSGGFIFRFVS